MRWDRPAAAVLGAAVLAMGCTGSSPPVDDAAGPRSGSIHRTVAVFDTPTGVPVGPSAAEPSSETTTTQAVATSDPTGSPVIPTAPIDNGTAATTTVPSSVVSITGTQTCHDEQLDEGTSTQRVEVSVEPRSATQVRLGYRLEEGSDGSPTRRIGAGTTDDDGTGIVRVPLYGPGETLVLVEVVVDGAAAEVPEHRFTTGAYEDPSTRCRFDAEEP